MPSRNNESTTMAALTFRATLGLWLMLVPVAALAQGQDGTPAERNLLIIAELFPGIYDNANQNYFDGRLNLPEDLRHIRLHGEVTRIDLPAFGSHAFWVEGTRGGETEPYLRRIYAFAADDEARAVRMKMYVFDGEDHTALTGAAGDVSKLDGLTPETANYQNGCDVLWRREVGQFRGRTDRTTCTRALDGVEAAVDFELMLSPEGFWVSQIGYDSDGNVVSGNPDAGPYELLRARMFDCYADIPGVSGGRDEPFDRYRLNDIHDMGGIQWFTAKDGREFGVTLRNVFWPMNNEEGIFTRNSFVMYLLERTADGVSELTYGWTEPGAQRIGINMRWMLVNCYMVSNADVTPFWGREPRRP